MSMLVGQEPMHTQCPSCHQTITSNVTRSPTTKTHLIALLLCVFGCWPCVIIPYCTNSCRAATHTCPSCNTHLGTSLQ